MTLIFSKLNLKDQAEILVLNLRTVLRLNYRR